MNDATAEFLSELDRAGHESRLGRAEGTVRIELERDGRTERWFLDARRGQVNVSRKRVPYDCTVRTTGALFDGLVTGKVNAMTALLRGEIEVDGNPELLVLVQRLFPGPPRASAPARARRPRKARP
jgi:putative sterol carrier protein